MDTINPGAQAQLNEEGQFRAIPLSWTLEPSQKEGSQSVAVVFQFGIVQKWHPEVGDGAWSQEWPQGHFVYNRTYIVKKDGGLNDGAMKGLREAGLWNGDWDAFEGPVPQVVVIVDVKRNEWQGNVSYRAEWINPNAEQPVARTGGLKPVDKGVLSDLRQRFQSGTNAVMGGQPAAGAPPTPPSPGGAAAPPSPGAVGDPLSPAGSPPPAPGAVPGAGGPAGAPAPPGAPQPPMDPQGIDPNAGYGSGFLQDTQAMQQQIDGMPG